MTVLRCCKCYTEFEDTGRDYPAGVFCSECRRNGYKLVGICHRYDTETEEWLPNIQPEMNGEGI